MKLNRLFDYLIHGQKLIVRVPVEMNTSETFEVEVMRDQRYGSWREEYDEWLKKLDLEVATLFAGDTGNLLVTCKPVFLLPSGISNIIIEGKGKYGTD